VTGGAGPSADGSTPIRAALVTEDPAWARAQATALAAAALPVRATPYDDLGRAVDDLGEFDCAVVSHGLGPAVNRPYPGRIRARHPDLPVVLVVPADVDWEEVADVDPTEVYVRIDAEPRPERLARRVQSAVRAAGTADSPAFPTERLRDLLGAVGTPVAVTDGTGAVRLTNPAFKATFGLAERLPSGLPDEPAGDRQPVECETLDGPRSFEYGAVPLHEDVVCHVLRTQSASPVRRDSVEASTPTTEDRSAAEPTLDALTDRQREVLETAYAGGFFERPKANNSEELAARLGITRSTFLQHLRTAQRKLLTSLLG